MVFESASVCATSLGRSKSNPGRTTAPCGRFATCSMNNAVAPRDPVDPATITGCCKGVDCQALARCVTTVRSRAPGPGSVEPSKYGRISCRNFRLRSQCAACSATSSLSSFSRLTPSVCISSTSATSDSARLKSELRGAMSGVARRRAAMACATSNLCRMGGAAGGSRGA